MNTICEENDMSMRTSGTLTPETKAMIASVCKAQTDIQEKFLECYDAAMRDCYGNDWEQYVTAVGMRVEKGIDPLAPVEKQVRAVWKEAGGSLTSINRYITGCRKVIFLSSGDKPFPFKLAYSCLTVKEMVEARREAEKMMDDEDMKWETAINKALDNARQARQEKRQAKSDERAIARQRETTLPGYLAGTDKERYRQTVLDLIRKHLEQVPMGGVSSVAMRNVLGELEKEKLYRDSFGIAG